MGVSHTKITPLYDKPSFEGIIYEEVIYGKNKTSYPGELLCSLTIKSKNIKKIVFYENNTILHCIKLEYPVDEYRAQICDSEFPIYLMDEDTTIHMIVEKEENAEVDVEKLWRFCTEEGKRTNIPLMIRRSVQE